MAWFKCKKCGNLFVYPDIELKNKKKLPKCPKCKSEDILDEDFYNRSA